MSITPTHETPIDPTAATNLVEFKEMLARLRASKGNPSFNKMERDAGPGNLSHAMAHRLVQAKWDLASIRDCERAVSTFVATLGETPEPWVEVVTRLLVEARNPRGPVAPPPSSAPASPRWSQRRKLVLGAGVIAVTVGVVATTALTDSPLRFVPVYDQPVAIELAAGGLRVALADDTTRISSTAIVRDTPVTAAGTWLVTAPHRDSANHYQLRHFDGGHNLVCLEVRDKSYAEDAAIQFAGCNGEIHQYWSLETTNHGYLRITNHHSGKCLGVAGSGEPQPGRHVVQRECNDDRPAQQWKTMPSTAPQQFKAPIAGSLNPAELPHGGEDKRCQDGVPNLDVDSTLWNKEKTSVRDSRPAQGMSSIGPAASLAEMVHSNTINPATNVEETYYWVEGYTKFTPDRFRIYLQWTTVRGPGDWHTCEVRLPEQGTAKSIAVPRDRNNDRIPDTWFRICMTYQPPLGELILQCSADRY